MMPPLDHARARRVGLVAAMTESPIDAEALIATRKLNTLLGDAGYRIAEVIERGLAPPMIVATAFSPPPVAPSAKHRKLVIECQAHPDLLNDWETEFLASILFKRRLSDRQRETLDRLVAKVRRKAANGGI